MPITTHCYPFHRHMQQGLVHCIPSIIPCVQKTAYMAQLRLSRMSLLICSNSLVLLSSLRGKELTMRNVWNNKDYHMSLTCLNF